MLFGFLAAGMFIKLFQSQAGIISCSPEWHKCVEGDKGRRGAW